MNEPKYQEVLNRLRADILSGVYPVGSRLPSENELVGETGYSRQTIRQAMGILEKEGLTSRVRGSGTYVEGNRAGRKRSHQIAVVCTSIRGYIFTEILDGIHSVIAPQGYVPMLFATENRVEEERRILTQLLEMPVDGIIIQGTKTALPTPNRDLYRQLAARQIPVVFINSCHSGIDFAICVAPDDQQGGRMACRYLIDRGHKEIAGIFKSDDMPGTLRYTGYMEELLQAGLPIRDEHLIWYTTETDGQYLDDRAEEVLRACTGLICYNDNAASRILRFCEERSIPLGAERELVSFDHSSVSELPGVPFISLVHPKRSMGEVAGRKMLHLLDGEKEETVLLPWKIRKNE